MADNPADLQAQSQIFNLSVSSNNQLHEHTGGNRDFFNHECTSDDLLSNIIDLIQSYPVLWNISLRGYRDVHKKEQAWREMGLKLHSDGMYSFTSTAVIHRQLLATFYFKKSVF